MAANGPARHVPAPLFLPPHVCAIVAISLHDSRKRVLAELGLSGRRRQLLVLKVKCVKSSLHMYRKMHSSKGPRKELEERGSCQVLDVLFSSAPAPVQKRKGKSDLLSQGGRVIRAPKHLGGRGGLGQELNWQGGSISCYERVNTCGDQKWSLFRSTESQQIMIFLGPCRFRKIVSETLGSGSPGDCKGE